MKSPIDIVKGRIVDYDPVKGEVTIKAVYPDWFTAMKRGYSECRVQMIDSRPLSGKQRNLCYKLIREISEYTGEGIDRTKETLKKKFVEEELYDSLESDFSLSNAPMSTAAAFERWIVRFMLDYDIPASFPLLEFVDDVHDYLYACLIFKKCCICGKPSDLHHVDRIGMGRDREEVIHEGMEVLPLYRIHHDEVHRIGQKTFNARNHIESGVTLDADLCRIYRLKRAEDAREAAQAVNEN